MMINRTHFVTIRKILLITIVFSAMILAIFFFLWRENQQKEEAETTSREPSAQSNFTYGVKREVVQSKKNEGIITDTNGSIHSMPPSSEWSSSPSGVITVYSPAKNSLLLNGSVLSGESSADRISFRMIDSVTGVIAQGSISVVNKKFSGKFSFETIAPEGRLDVFTTNDEGIESNVIEIPVRFKK